MELLLLVQHGSIPTQVGIVVTILSPCVRLRKMFASIMLLLILLAAQVLN